MKNINYYTGDIIPKDDTIFVLGSNIEGIHNVGITKLAMILCGAKYGQGEGSYGLPITVLNHNPFEWGPMPLDEITEHIKIMYECAKANPDKKFKIAYRCQPNEKTLYGYYGKELIQCFKNACNGEYPDNIYFSEEWYNSGLL